MTACHICVTPQRFNPRQPCAVSNRGLVRATHANARGLHNPQPMLHPFRRHDRKHAAHQLEYLPPTGFSWSQHDDADVLGRRVGPDVREIEVESEEHARACLAGRCNVGIVCAGEPFVVDRVALPGGRAQELSRLDGKVLIELRAHTPKLRGERQDSLLRRDAPCIARIGALLHRASDRDNLGSVIGHDRRHTASFARA
jgi:hypothetical protein